MDLIDKIFKMVYDLKCEIKSKGVKYIIHVIRLTKKRRKEERMISISKVAMMTYLGFWSFVLGGNTKQPNLIKYYKWMLFLFNIHNVISPKDILFYSACELCLCILGLRLFNKKRHEHYAVKNALVIYLNFLAVERFIEDIVPFFNLFMIAYITTYLALLFRSRRRLFVLFDTIFEATILVIYLQLFIPGVLTLEGWSL